MGRTQKSDRVGTKNLHQRRVFAPLPGRTTPAQAAQKPPCIVGIQCDRWVIGDQRLGWQQARVAACFVECFKLMQTNAGRFLSGLRRRGTPGQWGKDAPLVQVFGSDPIAFLGSAHITADELIPQRLLSPIEVQDILQAAH